MTNRQKRMLLVIFTGLMMFAGGAMTAYAQPAPPEVEGPLRTLTGRIRWPKSMGVMPKSPGSQEPLDNICSQFFVVVRRMSSDSQKPIQYDIALEDKPEPSKPDYYSCLFDMKVPSNVSLAVYPGMGDGLAWRPDAPKYRHHYQLPWIDVTTGRFVRKSGSRTWKPENRVVVVSGSGLNIPFELVYEDGGSGQTSVAPANGAFLVAGNVYFPTPNNPVGLAPLQWDAGPDHPNAEVWVKIGDSRERTIFAKQPKGGQQVQVARGLMYTYVLMDGRNVLATAVVRGQ